jgi:hypothetical protein
VWWHQQGEIALSEKTALPSIDPVDENLVVELDWQKIKAAYRAGEPLRAISEQFGIGKNVISRKAKREGWQRSGTDPGQDTGKTQEKPGTSDVVPRASDDNKDFDWYADDLVVLQEQPRTALYFNPNGALVIRQVNEYFDDPFVFIAPEYFESFMEKLSDLFGIPLGRKSS